MHGLGLANDLRSLAARELALRGSLQFDCRAGFALCHCRSQQNGRSSAHRKEMLSYDREAQSSRRHIRLRNLHRQRSGCDLLVWARAHLSWRQLVLTHSYVQLLYVCFSSSGQCKHNSCILVLLDYILIVCASTTAFATANPRGQAGRVRGCRDLCKSGPVMHPDQRIPISIAAAQAKLAENDPLAALQV